MQMKMMMPNRSHCEDGDDNAGEDGVDNDGSIEDN